MQSNNSNLYPTIIITIVAILIIGGVNLYTLEKQSENIQNISNHLKNQKTTTENKNSTEIKNSVEKLEDKIANLEKQIRKEGQKENKKCYKTYDNDDITDLDYYDFKTFSFEYPCDWKKDLDDGTGLGSSVGRIVAPDKKASFYIMSPDFGLHGSEETKEEEVKINNKEYTATTHSKKDSNSNLTFVEIGEDLGGAEHSLMIMQKGQSHEEEIQNILNTLEF